MNSRTPKNPNRWRRVARCHTTEPRQSGKSLNEAILIKCEERGDNWAHAVEHRVLGAVSCMLPVPDTIQIVNQISWHLNLLKLLQCSRIQLSRMKPFRLLSVPWMMIWADYGHQLNYIYCTKITRVINLCNRHLWKKSINTSGIKYLFYMPVLKTLILCCSNVRPCEFSTLFSTSFDISIWNFLYTFSMWHNMSSLSFIVIGLLWPTLHPKVVQTHFLQSWSHEWR